MLKLDYFVFLRGRCPVQYWYSFNLRPTTKYWKHFAGDHLDITKNI